MAVALRLMRMKFTNVGVHSGEAQHNCMFSEPLPLSPGTPYDFYTAVVDGIGNFDGNAR